MKILIDADGCPVVDICIKSAKRHGIECLILCDTSHIFEREGAKTVTVSKGADSVDFKIVNLLERGDIVVTQDYGLAAMALAKRATVITQNGLIINDFNTDNLLYSRHLAKKARRSGMHLKGPSKRTKEQDAAFERALTELLNKNNT